jgi:lysine 2,3-aminomutase
VDDLIAYVAANPEIEEVILSGGDPLSAPRSALQHVLRRLREETHVEHLRVHSRNLVFAPHMLTEEHCEIFAQWRVRFVAHIVHPYELVEQLRGALARLQSFGVRCYAQFPILRGVNDHMLVLKRLLMDLDEENIRPVGMFVPDPISYSASFRLRLSRIFTIVDELNASTAAWVNSVRLIIDTPIGKVRRENIVDWDSATGWITFERAGQRIRYRDLPVGVDVPGDIETLLWRG